MRVEGTTEKDPNNKGGRLGGENKKGRKIKEEPRREEIKKGHQLRLSRVQVRPLPRVQGTRFAGEPL